MYLKCENSECARNYTLITFPDRLDRSPAIILWLVPCIYNVCHQYHHWYIYIYIQVEVNLLTFYVYT